MRVVIAIGLAATIAAGAYAGAPPKAATIADAWRSVGGTTTGHACGDDLMFDYGAEGGMRNFFCRALTYFSWKTFLSLSPVKPFAKGPHTSSKTGGKLNLKSERDFGRYDPKFVRWAVDNLVPAATDVELKTATQKAYDTQLKHLARGYWQVHRAVTSDPAWLEREVNIYLRAADDKSVKWDQEVVWFYHDVLGDADHDWGGHDPNLVRSATMYWLRRTKDGTAALWHEGLEKLLRTYDGAWLAQQKGKPFEGKLPQRPAPQGTPEYR